MFRPWRIRPYSTNLDTAQVTSKIEGPGWYGPRSERFLRKCNYECYNLTTVDVFLPNRALGIMKYEPHVFANNCRLCSIFQGKDGASGVDTPWLTNDAYAALISIGALVPGWTLLSPHSHAHNMLAAYSDPLFWEFTEVAERHVRQRYGRVTVFEHGPNEVDSLTGCGTGHAHMHMVPLPFSLETEALCFDPAHSWAPCSASEIERRVGGREYLFVSDKFEGSTTRGMLCVLQEPTSQFFRQVVAKALGKGEFFDYKRYPMLNIVAESSQGLSADAQAVVAESVTQTVG